MAASTEQKLDYLLKKIGYTASKTGLAEDSSLSGTKKTPFAESIPSPLVTASSSIWTDSDSIPGTPPGSDSSYVKVYLASASGHRMTADSTVSGSRAFIAYSTYNNTSTAILGDWIDTQFGDSYIIKVYKGDPNSGGTLLSAAGSGSNDTWFFDYASGVLNFNGTVVPSGVTDTNIYIVGYRYIGAKGTATAGINTTGTSFFEDIVVDGNAGIGSLNVTGITTVGFVTATDVWVSGAVTATTFESTIATGTSPFVVASTTKVVNLNADLLDGRDTSSSGGNDKIVLTDGSGNISIGSGTVTATTFSGNLTGTVNTAAQPNITSLGTLTSLDVTGNVSIGGTLTYDDVTNVDSIGLITARSGVKVTSGGIDVTGVSTFGGAIDANSTLEVSGIANFDSTVKIGDKIEHLGDDNTNIRFPDADTFAVETAGNERLRITSAGALQLSDTNSPNDKNTDIWVADDVLNFNAFGTNGAFIFKSGSSSTERLRILSDGKVAIGTATAGAAQCDTLTVETTGHTGMTFFSGTSSRGTIAFGDGRSGNAQYRGVIMYDHSDDSMRLVTSDAERLRITSAGKVGIGITNPDFQLHSFEDDGSSIAGLFETNQTDSYISFQASGTTASSTVRIGAQGNDFTAFINGGERLRIDSSGQIGVGNVTPKTWQLGKAVHIGNAENAMWGEGDYALHMIQNAYYNSGYKKVKNAKSTLYTQSLGEHSWYTSVAAAADAANVWTEVMRIDDGGNVGIGTNNPVTKFVVSNGGEEGLEVSHASGTVEVNAYKRSDSSRSPFEITAQTFKMSTGNPSLSAGLHQDVNGSVIIGNATYGAAGSFSVGVNGTFRSVLASGTAQDTLIGAISAVSNGFQINTDASNNQTYTFHNGSASSLHITSAGKVGINTTNPGSKLEVWADDSDTDTDVFSVRGKTSAFNIRVDDADASNPTWTLRTYSSEPIAFAQGTDERLRITSTGQLLLGVNNAVDAEVDLQIHSATSGNGPILNLTNDTGDCRIFFGQDDSSGSANAQGQIRYNVASNYLATYTAGSERLRILSDGKVGIGLTDPQKLLDLYQSSGNTTIGVKAAGGNDANIELVETGGTAIDFGETGSAGFRISYHGGDNKLYFTSGNDTTTNNRVSILRDSGYVGINEDTPTARLHIVEATSTTALKIKSGTNTNQNTHITMYNDNDIPLNLGVFGSSATTVGTIAANTAFMTSNSAGGLAINASNASGVIKFGTGSGETERLRIDSSGNFDIPFADNGTGLRQKIRFVTESTYFDEVAYISADRTAVSSAPTDLVFGTGALDGGSVNTQERLRITSAGLVGIGTVNPTSLLTVGARPKTTATAATVLISPASGNASIQLRGGSPTLEFDGTGGGNGQIFTDSADLTINDGTLDGSGNEILRITSARDVLIGTNTNAGGNRLYVVDNFTDAYVNPSDSIVRIENSNTSGTTGQASISFTSKTSGSNADSAIVSQAEDASGNARLEFWTDTANVMTEKMAITSSGSVLIGTAITAHAGIITATKFVTSTGTSGQFVKGDGSLDSSNYILEGDADLDLVLGNGNSTTKGMQVGIATFTGTVTVNSEINARRLTLSDDGSASPILLIKTDDTNPWGFQLRNDTYGTGSEGLKLYQSNTGVNYVQTRGTSARGRLIMQQHNGTTTNDMIEFTEAGEIELHHQGNERLRTTGIGVSVIGVGNTAYIEGPGEIWIDPHPFGVGTTSGIVRVRGDLYVDGTEFIVDVDKIELGDFQIGIATTAGTNALLDGAGIGIGSESIRKTITWNDSSEALKSSEHFDLASGKRYKINGNGVLSANGLGSGVVNSSLTSVGILTGLTVDGDLQFTGQDYNAFWDKSVNALQFSDNAKATWGDHAGSGDLQIYHSGNHSYIKDSGTGALVVNSDNFYVNNAADNETLIHVQEDVGVKLYDGANIKRFETTNTGAIVTGILTATQIADSNNSVGSASSVLSSTGSGLEWVAQSGGGGGAAGLWQQTDVGINTSSKVGIGTTSPNYKLEVSGTNNNSYLSLENTTAADGDGNRYSRILFRGTQSGGEVSSLAAINGSHDGAADDQKGRISFRTNDGSDGESPTERLRINSGGQVLVGTDTNPAYTNRRFTVADSTNSGTCAVEIRGSASGDSRLYFTSSTTSGQTGAYAGKVKYDHANNTMGFYVNGTTEALRITSAGKVGIGTDLTTTPSSVLTVAPHTTSGRNISIYTSGAVGNKAGLFFNATSGTGNLAEIQAEYKGTNSGDLIFNTSMVERLRIHSGGNIGIGTDTDSTQRLAVYGTNAAIMLQNPNTGTGSGNGFYMGNGNGTVAYLWNYENESIRFATNDTEKFRIDKDGRVVISNNAGGHAGGSQFVVMGGAINNYASAAFGNYTAAPTSGTTFAMFRFNSGSAGTSRGAEVIAAADADWTAGSSYPTRLVFSTTASSATSSTERLRIDSSGRALLGTQRTYGDLNYYDDITINNSNGADNQLGGTGITLISKNTSWNALLFGDSDDNDVGAIKYDHSNNHMRFVVNTIDPALYINSSGNVGIGTNSPSEILHILKDDTTGPTITLENDANKAYINNWGSVGGGTGRTNRFEINASEQAQASICAPYITFMAGGTGDGNEKLRITGNGELNVGTTTSVLTQSTYKLQVETGSNKTISFGNAAHNDMPNQASGIFFSRQSTGAAQLSGIFGHSNESLGIAARANITLHAGGGSGYEAAPERVRITSDGNVGIGTDDPDSLLHISGSAPRITLSDTAGTDDTGKIFSTGGVLYVQQRDDSSYGSIIFRTENNSTATQRFSINSAGVKTILNGNLNISSTYIDFSGDVSTPSTAAAIYRPADNTLAFSTANEERLRINSSGNVGIGTDNPAMKLHLHEDSSSASYMIFTNSTSGVTNNDGLIIGLDSNEGANFWLNESDYMKFGTADTERLRINSSGNVGIGTDNPLAKLALHGSGGGTFDAIHITNSDTGVAGTDGTMIGLNSSEDFTIWNAESTNVVIAAGNDERLRIKSTGGLKFSNMGTGSMFEIGDSTVKENAAINIHRLGNGYGNIRLSSNYGVYTYYAGASDNTDELWVGQDNLKHAYVFNEANKALYFGTNNATRMTLTNGGRLGLGTTDPGSTLWVTGASTIDSATFRTADSNGTSSINILSEGTTGYSRIKFSDTAGQDGSIRYDHGNRRIAFAAGGTTDQLYITSAGNVGIGTDNPNHELTVYGDAPNFRMTHTGSTNYLNSFYTQVDGTGVKFNSYQEVTTTRRPFIFEQYTTEVMRIDATGNVGIGLTNPTEKLEVSGSINVSDSYKIATHPLVSYASFVLDGGNYAARLGSTGTSTIRHTQIYAGGTHQATFDGVNNRLGIGVTNPQRKLVVSDNGTEGFEFFPGDSANGGTLNLYNRATTAFVPLTINSSDFRWAPSGGTEAFRITSGGNLKLPDSGKIELGGVQTGSGDLQIYHSTENYVDIADGQILYFREGGDNKFYVQPGGAQFVGSLYADDGNKIELGNDQELKIYHDNVWSYIDNNASNNFVIRVNGTDNSLVSIPNGRTILYNSGDERFSTTGIGVSVIGVGNTAYIEGPSEIWIDPHPAGVGQTSGIVRIRGDLYVDGTEFIVDVDKLEIGDFQIGIASTAATNSALDGAGIGIGSESIRKTITWNNTTSALMSSENWNLASGKHYEIAGTDVLTSTTLGSGVVNSSLTSVGTLSAVTVSGTAEFDGGVNFDNADDAGKDLQWQPTSDRLAFFDGVKATFGNSANFEIYQSGNHSYMIHSNASGNYFIRSTKNLALQSGGETTGIDLNADGWVALNYSGSEKLKTNNHGVVITGVATATDFDSTSDIRLKTNIKPIDDPLAKVIQIEGVSFNWKENNRPALGVIADQVQEIIPELVHGDDPKTVNYNGLIGLLIEAVKEQQIQIDSLKNRLSKLE